MSKYSESGVDVNAGYRSVDLIKPLVASTFRSEVIGGLGGFGGAFSLSKVKDMTDPILISGTDGVGTKLKLAHILDKHDTVGVDCVAMCVNDIVCSGAEPLFFLDYIATGKNIPEKIKEIVSGVAEGCRESNCSLIGGETAEMPGFYAEDEYDIAGFAVGVVDKLSLISPDNQESGDVLVGLESNGVHSNGFSLVRSVFRIDDNPDILEKHFDDLGSTLGEELLKPTKIYTKVANKIASENLSLGFAHITGGGFIENIPRALKDGLGASIEVNKIAKQPIFELLKAEGDVPENEMYNTFNCGIGMVVVCKEKDAERVVSISEECDIKASVIGRLTDSSGVVLA